MQADNSHPVMTTRGWRCCTLCDMAAKAKSKDRRTAHMIGLRAIRERHGLTLEEMAERLGSTKASVQRIETGSQNWKSDFLAAVVAEFGVSAADLFSLDDPETQSIMKKLANLPKEKRELAEQMIKAMSA